MKFRLLPICVSIFLAGGVCAQNYSAIHGSNYAGGLGVYNNPASILSSPYKWDVTVFAFQYQTISNAVKGPNFPFNLFPNATFYVANGNFKRYADVTSDVHLLNGRYALNESSAIGFGLNVRANTQGKTSSVHYTDSVRGPRSFLFLNEQNSTLEVDAASNAWMEFYVSYAKTFWDVADAKLSGGISLKILRGMSGAFAQANNVGVVSEQENDQVVYKIVNGNVKYGYSANHGDGESFNASDFFAQAKTGFAIDLGAEYIIKSQSVTSVLDEQVTDYDWKIGFSLLDLGWNNYAYSSESRQVSSIRDDVTSFVLQEKFSDVTGVSSFNDSVATIVNNSEVLAGNFKVMNPARAVLNIDRYLSGNWYINGELSVNLSSAGGNRYAVKESRLLAITPRWETRKLGFFAPVQVTRHGNFWIGGAVKAGPVLVGTHNLLNIFSKNKFLASGAYVAFTIRPFETHRDVRNRQYECPPY